MSDFLRDAQEYMEAFNNFKETRDRCCTHSGPGYNPGTDYIWNSRYQKRVHDSIRKIESLVNELCLDSEISDGAKSNLYLVLEECGSIMEYVNQVQ